MLSSQTTKTNCNMSELRDAMHKKIVADVSRGQRQMLQNSQTSLFTTMAGGKFIGSQSFNPNVSFAERKFTATQVELRTRASRLVMNDTVNSNEKSIGVNAAMNLGKPSSVLGAVKAPDMSFTMKTQQPTPMQNNFMKMSSINTNIDRSNIPQGQMMNFTSKQHQTVGLKEIGIARTRGQEIKMAVSTASEQVTDSSKVAEQQKYFQSQLDKSIKRVINEINLETLFQIQKMDDQPLAIIEDQLTKEFSKQILENPNESSAVSNQDKDQEIIADQQFQINLQRFIESRMVMGVSPTGTVNNAQQQDTAKSNKDKFAADQSHEVPSIFAHVTSHVQEWAQLKSQDDIEVKRLNGNSNAVFKVQIKYGLYPEIRENRALLYRRYEQDIIDKQIEQAIFRAMSDDGSGPKMFFQNNKFRIEEFFEGRPLTLWEMRNPMVFENFARKICDFNFNSQAQKDVNSIEKLDSNNLFIHQVIKEWGPNLENKIETIKTKLRESGTPEHLEYLQKTELLERTFLFKNYQQYFESLIPKPNQPVHFDSNYVNPFPNVLTHNDCHQNNILMSVKNNRELIIIDNEYAGWNPMAMDVAVFVNETMNDNSYPGKNGVEWYTDNIMSEQELERFVKAYLTHYFDKYMEKDVRNITFQGDVNMFFQQHYRPFLRQVLDCCLLNNFFWGVWALSLLSEEQYLNSGIFNYDFAHSRCDMYNTFKNFISEYESSQQQQANQKRSSILPQHQEEMNEFQLSLLGRQPTTLAGNSKQEL